MKITSSNKEELLKKLQFDQYFEADSWDEYNLKFFEGLAKKYDATNLLHSFGMKSIMDTKFVERLPIKQNTKILDLCTGSGDIAIKIAKKYPNVEVVGVDASAAMLEIARNRSKELPNIRFEKGDALAVSFPDNTFDGAVISFGLRNLNSIESGFLEMQRVVKSGGFISNIDQSKPKNCFLKLIYRVYFCNIAPLIGKVIFHRGEFNSFRYLSESNNFFPDQVELCSIMKGLGFRVGNTFDYYLGAVGQQIAYVV